MLLFDEMPPQPQNFFKTVPLVLNPVQPHGLVDRLLVQPYRPIHPDDKLILDNDVNLHRVFVLWK